ncbi:MAG: ThiF family adenylyltransferase [Burkholderiaceae bacterium]
MPDDSRYLRHRQIPGFSQQAVQALRVLVIGAGAIGNEVVKNLVLLGAGEITVFDMDRVERHNLTRSVLLHEDDIGQMKAQALAQRAGRLNADCRVHAVVGDIHDTLTLAHLQRADLLICGADNFEARIRTNQACLLMGLAWINAAIDSRHVSIDTFPFDAERAPACYECGLPGSVYERLARRQSCGGLTRAALADKVMPTTTITTSLAGALAVNEALRLAGCDNRAAPSDGKAGTRIFMDSLGGTAARTTLGPAPLCAGCGSVPFRPALLGEADSARRLLELAGDPQGQQHYQLSDPLIWSCACETCGPSPVLQALVGSRARAQTDAITICARCRQPSVRVEVRETFTGAELLTQFGDRPPTGRWALADAGLIALNGDADVRPPTDFPMEPAP